MSPTSIALSNLRAVVILIVLAFHSSLAYLASLPPAAYEFNTSPYLWQAVPVVDSERFFGLDLFCAWQDVSLMSLMFFLSGLFVPSSLARKGTWTYLSDRLLRIGLPFLFAVVVLMPLAYYPAYRQTAADPGVAAYWKSWMALPFWPCGPQWFLWELLTFNIVAMLLHRLAPNWCGALGRLAGHARGSPLRFFMALAAVSAVVYVPLALIFLPWEWTHTGLLSFQLSRPLHYLVYFLAGFAIGTDGLERSVLAVEGPLARQWAGWLGAGLLGFGLWALPTSFTLEAGAPIIFHIAAAFGYAIACASGSFALLALCLRFATVRRWTLDSLSANAYGMYLLHYVFVVWLQFALLNVALFAVAKATIAFAVTLGMSWVLSAASSGVSFGSRLAGAKR